MEPEHDAQRSRLPRRHGSEVVGQAPREGGRQAEGDPQLARPSSLDELGEGLEEAAVDPPLLLELPLHG